LHDGQVHYGEPLVSSPEEPHDQLEKGALNATVLKPIGTNRLEFEQLLETDKPASVKRLLGPLTPEMVPIIRCVDLNYLKHSE
jgi:hypothetical protein